MKKTRTVIFKHHASLKNILNERELDTVQSDLPFLCPVSSLARVTLVHVHALSHLDVIRADVIAQRETAIAEVGQSKGVAVPPPVGRLGIVAGPVSPLSAEVADAEAVAPRGPRTRAAVYALG